ncbi:YhcN/YlaJ family sporulation lipoprotein [Cohnella fermenti]|uniref:YhcN/YlaJ family sporulation lipoprotein n=1 Tax=Cohnella fermenti TaxID=2565925 RepID=A0A4S4BLG8_9BACL|nr:YhcN/YlaJ family sporulation lipoprotein [Cohnella fermenti]THF75616.1 YhcN/YlaJ family sporulation lipoprotein [Cohnella fermenti]
MQRSSTLGGIGSALLFAALTLGTVGCGHAKDSNRESSPELGHRLEARSAGEANAIAKTNATDVANHLEKLASGVQGVRGATCVVFGKYAVVGIDVEPTLERSRVGTVKYAVAEAFRKDPYGIDAVVTADIDMAQRLREIRTDVKAGRPIAGFAEEMADIVGRLVPQIPRSVIPPASPDGTAEIEKLQTRTGGGSSPAHTSGR